MKKRFKNILAKKRKKNGAAVLICAIMLAVSLGTLVGCSITKENIEGESGSLRIEDIPVESVQTNDLSQNPGNNSFEVEHYRLTDTGEIIYEKHAQAHEAWLARDMAFIKGFSEEQLNQVTDFMNQYIKHLDRNIEESESNGEGK